MLCLRYWIPHRHSHLCNPTYYRFQHRLHLPIRTLHHIPWRYSSQGICCPLPASSLDWTQKHLHRLHQRMARYRLHRTIPDMAFRPQQRQQLTLRPQCCRLRHSTHFRSSQKTNRWYRHKRHRERYKVPDSYNQPYPPWSCSLPRLSKPCQRLSSPASERHLPRWYSQRWFPASVQHSWKLG